VTGFSANGNIVSAGGVEYYRFKTDGGVEVRVTALKSYATNGCVTISSIT
jgi:hypothetical protein